MLRLFPKDVVNYIYETIHKSNTQDIIGEYIQKVTAYTPNNKHENNCYIIYLDRHRYNDRDLIYMEYSYFGYKIYNPDGLIRAKLPERYVYSLTRQEFKSMSNKMKNIPD
jgi:hypothetical protein